MSESVRDRVVCEETEVGQKRGSVGAEGEGGAVLEGEGRVELEGARAVKKLCAG